MVPRDQWYPFSWNQETSGTPSHGTKRPVVPLLMEPRDQWYPFSWNQETSGTPSHGTKRLLVPPLSRLLWISFNFYYLVPFGSSSLGTVSPLKLFSENRYTWSLLHFALQVKDLLAPVQLWYFSCFISTTVVSFSWCMFTCGKSFFLVPVHLW